jgi:hypothetical protein
MKQAIRLSIGLAVLAAAFSLAACDGRKADSGKTNATPAVAADAEAGVVAELETKQQDAGFCRTVLQRLDNLPSVADRPTYSQTELAEVARLLRITPSESAEVNQATFTSSDALYLAECLLIRAGIRSLRLEERPPLEQGRLVFDWVCRLIYIDDRVPTTINPWMAFQTGWGIALTRAYAVLAAWQQAGLEGYLVGPPTLKDSPSAAPNPVGSRPAATYAPVRACALRIGGDLFLFDPATGQPLHAADGASIVTLAQVRAKPELAPGVDPPDEAKNWRAFIAPPLSGTSLRMAWLEKLNPGNLGVKLYLDVAKARSRTPAEALGGPCEAWNPPGDQTSATRILALVATEESSNRNQQSLRETYQFRALPIQQIPLAQMKNAGLLDEAVLILSQAFAQPFDDLRYASKSPRDLLIRGQFQQVTSALEDTKRVVENARSRIEQDKVLGQEFTGWARRFQDLVTALNTARLRDPTAVPAALRALDEFRNVPANRDIERAFVIGSAARPLGAEVIFLMAACVHERAERAQIDNPARAKASWRNAIEWWERFLDASTQAQSPFPAREPHARALLARCRQLAGK